MLRKSSLIAYSILLFPIALLIARTESGFLATVFSYYDELVGCISIAYVSALVFQKKTSNTDNLIYGLMVVLTVIGVLSNAIYRVSGNVFAILVDIVFLWKPIACFLAFKHYAVWYRENMVRVLYPWAKAILAINAVLSVVGQFVDIGVMRGYAIGNIEAYAFFWRSPYQTVWLVISSLLIIAANGVGEKRFLRYFMLAIVPLFLAGTTMSWGWIILEIILLITLRENKVFRKRALVLLAIIMVALFYSELSFYLLRDTAPRARFLSGAVEVAKIYFPLGSGFATYGSEMASRFYSPIYVAFGWENAWGLGRVYSQYINDNFFACIVGQFGWVGLFCYLMVQLNVFKKVNSVDVTRIERVTSVTTVLALVASMVGSASAKSAMGTCVFAILGIMASKAERMALLRNSQDKLDNQESQKDIQTDDTADS